jgi:hypothetical protein
MMNFGKLINTKTIVELIENGLNDKLVKLI